MMNSDWLMERARDVRARSEVRQQRMVQERIGALYQIIYQREPDSTEVAAARAFLDGFAASEQQVGLERLTHALLQTNEVLYVQ